MPSAMGRAKDARLRIAGTDPDIGRRSPVRKGRDGLLTFVASTLVPHGAAALSPAQRHCCAMGRRTKLSSFGSKSTTCHARVRMELQDGKGDCARRTLSLHSHPHSVADVSGEGLYSNNKCRR